MVRLVFGLGTRAVDRADDDYTRLVALNAPDRRPESEFEYTQRKVDVLDLEANLLTSTDFQTAAQQSARLPIELFASRDPELERLARERGVRDGFAWTLTFEQLLGETPFVRDMRAMAKTIQDAYEYPVDIEFTANFVDEETYNINLVQCRPFQVKGTSSILDPPQDIAQEDLVLTARGPVIGQSRIDRIGRLIYVVPKEYAQLPINQRYSIARLIGDLTHLKEAEPPETTMLLGPGRWGTTTPSLGVPVSFAEINTVSIVCEIVAMTEDIIPDVSLGTHFFSDLVETDMLYLALFPTKEGNLLNHGFFEGEPNRLAELLPRASAYAHVVKVIDSASLSDGHVVRLNANTLKQRVVCYLDREDASALRPAT